MKVRQLKKILFSRRWFSRRIEGDIWNQGEMCFLAYGDVRSHQKVRWPSSGKLALSLHDNDMYNVCRRIKRGELQYHREKHRDVRKMRAGNAELRRMSFHASVRLYNHIAYARRTGNAISVRFSSKAHLIS